MRYAMIMAGGAGTRLWPMSRKGLPKQLIPFIRPGAVGAGGAGESGAGGGGGTPKSLLGIAARRAGVR